MFLCFVQREEDKRKIWNSTSVEMYLETRGISCSRFRGNIVNWRTFIGCLALEQNERDLRHELAPVRALFLPEFRFPVLDPSLRISKDLQFLTISSFHMFVVRSLGSCSRQRIPDRLGLRGKLLWVSNGIESSARHRQQSSFL